MIIKKYLRRFGDWPWGTFALSTFTILFSGAFIILTTFARSVVTHICLPSTLCIWSTSTNALVTSIRSIKALAIIFAYWKWFYEISKTMIFPSINWKNISNNLKWVFTKFLKYLFHIYLYMFLAPVQIGLNPYTFYSTNLESTSNAHNTQMLGQRPFCGNRKNHHLDNHFLNNYPHILKTGNINY